MAVYCQVFNGRLEKYLFDKDHRKKIAFSPCFTKKLLLSPSQFKSSECLDELIKLNSILNIKTADLIFFPVIIQRHWVLMCLNVLHSNLNLFDSLNLTPPEDSERMLKNLSANFSTTCMDANLFPPWFSQFPCKALSKYPQEHDINETSRGLSVDCGFYSIAYMHAWDGLRMRDFDQETVVEFKKVVAYKIFHSKLNSTCPVNETVQDSPKRQKKK